MVGSLADAATDRRCAELGNLSGDTHITVGSSTSGSAYERASQFAINIYFKKSKVRAKLFVYEVLADGRTKAIKIPEESY